MEAATFHWLGKLIAVVSHLCLHVLTKPTGETAPDCSYQYHQTVYVRPAHGASTPSSSEAKAAPPCLPPWLGNLGVGFRDAHPSPTALVLSWDGICGLCLEHILEGDC